MMDITTLNAVTDMYREKSKWVDVGRCIAQQAYKNGEIDNVTDQHVNRYMSLAWGVYHGRVKSSPTLRRALGIRQTDVYTLAFRFKDRARFEAARAAVDAHPGGRSAWLLEQVQEVS